jgi:PhnB protein
MHFINPYMNFNGNTEEAFMYYKSVFGGEFLVLQRFKDTQEADKISPDDKEKIMHVSLPIGKGNVLMGSDALESMGQKLVVGNNFYLSVETDSKEETKKIFKDLSAGGVVTMPLADTFWGAYFGMLIDKFGVRWMVSCAEGQPK